MLTYIFHMVLVPVFALVIVYQFITNWKIRSFSINHICRVQAENGLFSSVAIAKCGWAKRGQNKIWHENPAFKHGFHHHHSLCQSRTRIFECISWLLADRYSSSTRSGASICILIVSVQSCTNFVVITVWELVYDQYACLQTFQTFLLY